MIEYAEGGSTDDTGPAARTNETMVDRTRLFAILQTDAERPPRPDAAAAAAQIVRDHGDTVAAVLFYGACLRDRVPGIVDLYILVDDYRKFHLRRGAALANRLLPPTVLFLPANAETNLGFKAAVMSRTAFRARMASGSLDTTVWARFCQPAALAYCRDDETRRWVGDTLTEAVATAVRWAVRLGPETGHAADYWTALFRHTYAAELRVEGGGRAGTIYDFAPRRFDALIAAAADGLTSAPDGGFRRTLTPQTIAAARRAWRRRALAGKILNLARLAKALFTFRDGVDYIVWKLERHSGQTVALTPWQKRHPLLAALFVLPALFRRGIIR
jgi:hypothetical protein